MPRTLTSSQWLDTLPGVACASVSTVCSTANSPTTPMRATWWHESSTVVTYTAPLTSSEPRSTTPAHPGLFADQKNGASRTRTDALADTAPVTSFESLWSIYLRKSGPKNGSNNGEQRSRSDRASASPWRPPQSTRDG